MDYQPSEVLAMLLTKTGLKKFRADPIKFHNTFFELRTKNPDIMNNFKFLKKSNPFSPTLERLILLFQLSGTLRRINPDYQEYQVIESNLRKFLPPETEAFEHFQGLEALKELGC